MDLGPSGLKDESGCLCGPHRVALADTIQPPCCPTSPSSVNVGPRYSTYHCDALTAQVDDSESPTVIRGQRAESVGKKG
jgi:hypothetical protein